MEIYKRLADIMIDIEAIAKDKTNQQQGFKYRGIDQIYNAVQPLLAKNRVFMAPRVDGYEREERTNAKGTTIFYVRITMKYLFFTDDGSSLECSVVGEGFDSGDKATNKAMAVAHKYALLQTFCIPTEDMPDPDAQTHDVKPQPTLKQYLYSKGFVEDEIRAFYTANGIRTADVAVLLLEDKETLNHLIKQFKEGSK